VWEQSKRDRRKDPFRIDQVNFNLLSPYTIRKMIDGRDLLLKLKAEFPEESASLTYNNMKINRSSLERGIELYQTGINKFLGNSIIKRLENSKIQNNSELQKRLQPDSELGKGEWVDLAGMIAPKKEVEMLLNEVEAGRIKTVDSLNEGFRKMHNSYYDWEWSWSCERIEEETGIAVNKITAPDIIHLVEQWKKSVIDLDNLLYDDARKEFTLSSMTGFGIDGGEEIKKLDFEQVRGEFESNSVVTAIREHIIIKTALGDELIERMTKIYQ
jgi:hypothetical protein